MTTDPTGREIPGDELAEAERQQAFATEQARAMRHPRLALCPAGAHPSFLIDSEGPQRCPWCELERLRARVAELEPVEQRAREVAATSGQDIHSAGPRETARHILGEAP